MSSDLQLRFGGTAQEHVCDGWQHFSVCCSNTTAYADGYICRTINYTSVREVVASLLWKWPVTLMLFFLWALPAKLSKVRLIYVSRIQFWEQSSLQECESAAGHAKYRLSREWRLLCVLLQVVELTREEFNCMSGNELRFCRHMTTS